MMPDRYEEIRKRLMLPDYNQAVDEDGNPIPKEAPSVIPPMSSEDRRAQQLSTDMNRNLASLASAVGPSLLGLMGGTAAEQESRFGQSNKLLQNISALELDKGKKLEKIVNEEGKPEFIQQANAVGMEPYFQPKAGSFTSGMLMKGQPAKFINKLTGDVISVAVGPDNVVRKLGHIEPFELTSDWVPHEGFVTPSATDIFGTKTTDLISKSAPNIKKNIKSTQGLGSYMGAIPLKEAESRYKEAAKGKEKVAESMATIGELEASENKLRNTQDPMTFSIALGQALRAVEKRLSEPEQRRFMGDDYRSIFQNAENYMSGKMGVIPDNIRYGVIEAIRYLKQREMGKVKANRQSYSDVSGLSQKGAETIKRTSGQGPGTQPTDDWRSDLKGTYR